MLRRQNIVLLGTALLGTAGLLFVSTASADGPKDNIVENVRRIPKLGIELTAEVRDDLKTKLGQLEEAIEGLRGQDSQEVTDLLPDVIIFHRAVHDALTHQEFFAEREIAVAEELLDAGMARAKALMNGESPWTTETGLVVRGYVSKIDHSVQPYGLVIPPNYSEQGTDAVRLDIWFHGRGETLSELNFLNRQMKRPGQYTPANTIVLHPYGRYCNAFKFAGEIDVLEALEDVKRDYRVDEDRISVRGFSMGGAACWQFAVLYTDRWFAANPGAGFSETPEFLRTFQQETLSPTWYERKLWQMYDCTGYAANLNHCPTVAYSGELDKQKQAADIMAEALAEEGVSLVHVIGPQTKHRIHEDSKVIIERKLSQIDAAGRQRVPRNLTLVTYSLRYNRMHWITVNALGQHWEKAQVKAAIRPDGSIHLQLQNVNDISIDFAPGSFPTELPGVPDISLSDAGRDFSLSSSSLPPLSSDRSWTCRLHKANNKWNVGEPEDGGLRKRHLLQGPIDDAFMDSFIIVRPSGTSRQAAVHEWVESELEHAIVHWRQQFRGDARVKLDDEISERDIAEANLILFGDPDSNQVLKRITDKLPLTWRSERIDVGNESYDAEHHALIAIYPNPLNPQRYVVVNSGFTYREYDYLNNARQVPKLPDWAIVDVRQPANSRGPGKIVAADFFNEQWQLRD